MRLRLIALVLFACSSLIFSCKESRNEISREQFIADFITQRDVGSKYRVYESLYMSTIPPDTYLSSEIVRLGMPGYQIAVNRAKTSNDISEIYAALHIVNRYNATHRSTCSNDELNNIKLNLNRIGQAKAAADIASASCGREIEKLESDG